MNMFVKKCLISILPLRCYCNVVLSACLLYGVQCINKTLDSNLHIISTDKCCEKN
jgi:hypothetical protein